MNVYKVQIDEKGIACCGTLEDAMSWLENADVDDKYIITCVYMDEDDYNSLKEFEGF